MSIISEAKAFLVRKTQVSHKELIEHVTTKCNVSYESARGTLIKREVLLDLGFKYTDGNLIECLPGEEGYHIDYALPEKLKNWQRVKALVGEVGHLVTLGGRQGHCVQVLEPTKVTTFDYEQRVLEDFSKKYPEAKAELGDILNYQGKSDVLNLDLIGYMCGSLFTHLNRLSTSRKHGFIVLTIQGQKSGFRNSGWWRTWATKHFTGEDPVLESIKACMPGYVLLDNNFYSRSGKSRVMRTTVWRRIK